MCAIALTCSLSLSLFPFPSDHPGMCLLSRCARSFYSCLSMFIFLDFVLPLHSFWPTNFALWLNAYRSDTQTTTRERMKKTCMAHSFPIHLAIFRTVCFMHLSFAHFLWFWHLNRLALAILTISLFLFLFLSCSNLPSYI